MQKIAAEKICGVPWCEEFSRLVDYWQQVRAPGDVLDFGSRNGLHVIRERNDRKQDKDEHRQSNQLRSFVKRWRVVATTASPQAGKPENAERGRKYAPYEIGKKFHLVSAIVLD